MAAVQCAIHKPSARSPAFFMISTERGFIGGFIQKVVAPDSRPIVTQLNLSLRSTNCPGGCPH